MLKNGLVDSLKQSWTKFPVNMDTRVKDDGCDLIFSHEVNYTRGPVRVFSVSTSMKRQTKIVCTLGPATATQPQIEALIRAGMNVARLNCSHGDWDAKNQWIQWIRGCRQSETPVAILADLQGPKFRIGEIPNGGVLSVKTGQVVTLSQHGATDLTVPSDVMFEKMDVGDNLLLGDGNVELRLTHDEGGVFRSEALCSGEVKSRQGMTLRGKSFSVPALTDKDRGDAIAAARAGVDFIALSYVRCADDLKELRSLIDSVDRSIRICAKIETRDALENLDEILLVSDVIMVARGDLGLQMHIEEVPLAQKKIIRACMASGTPVITATQMLESMIGSPRPTRAEASDVANAILDGTDAVMLSGETAAGAYPVEAVSTMARIAEVTEASFDHRAHFKMLADREGIKSTESFAQATVQMAMHLDVKAIVCTSTSGSTPQLISKYRPDCQILCATWSDRTMEQLAVTWGVEAAHIDLGENTDETIANALAAFVREGRISRGDDVLITAGVPTGVPGNTNLILHQKVK